MSTATGHHLSERELRELMGVLEASAFLDRDLKDMPQQAMRQKVARTVVEAEGRGACLAKHAPMHIRMPHDFRDDLATLARLNGWIVPEEWECPDR